MLVQLLNHYIKRFHSHKGKYNTNQYDNRLLYSKIKEFGIDDFFIELYENFPCNSKEELNKRECEMIR